MTDSTQRDLEALSQPLYDTSELARLLHIDAGKVKRWIEGYRYKSDGTFIQMEPTVHSAHSGQGASFLNLIELRFFKKFLEIGISPRKLRLLYRRAAQLLKVSNPFIRNDYYMLNSELFVKIIADEGHTNLLSLEAIGQLGIPQIIEQFGREISFSKDTGIATRWHPLESDHQVVLDPRRSSGIPILGSSGIKTEVVYDLYTAEGDSIHAVCDWFQISEHEARDAIQFEQSLLAA